MCTFKDNKRNSLPALSMNSFFVSKRASMFEVSEETAREKRERSPCGALESSERKLEARKEKEKRLEMVARRKCQVDPYAEESTEPEETFNSCNVETKTCSHASKAVNFGGVKRSLKVRQPFGICMQCHSMGIEKTVREDGSHAVIWMCLFCGHQGCDRSTEMKHAFLHYRTPHSNPHCLALNLELGTVWCYECDSEVIQKCHKRLHEVVQYIKQYSDTVSKGPSVASNDSSVKKNENSNQKQKNSKNLHSSVSADPRSQPPSEGIPIRAKGLTNLGNTCFFNSVIQVLAHTQYLKHLIGMHLQVGKRLHLPGCPKNAKDDSEETDNTIEEEDVDLKPLELFLPEAGTVSLALCRFLYDMTNNRLTTLNPGQLFGQICKKSTQFQGYGQHDAHEILRCLLDIIRNEEVVRAKRAILRGFGLSEKTDPSSVNARLRAIIKGYGKQVLHSFVDHIFGGYLISTIFCEECHWSSQVFEPFMDLSLPISEDKGKPKKSFSDDDCRTELVSSESNTVTPSKCSGIPKIQSQPKIPSRDKKAKGNASSKAGSSFDEDEYKKRMTEKRLSDADVEDNTDSEWGPGQSCYRHSRPSIVVCHSENEQNPCPEPCLPDNRFLLSANSFDHPGYNSASDTSERYFTANEASRYLTEIDTDDIDNMSERHDMEPFRPLSRLKKDFDGFRSISRLPLKDDEDHLKLRRTRVGQKWRSTGCLLDTALLNHKRSSVDNLQCLSERTSEDEEIVQKERSLRKLRSDWITKSLTTLSPRYQCRTNECTLMSCLSNFTCPELLTNNNKITCDNCSKLNRHFSEGVVKSNASKQLLVLSPPAVLTLHLKRFHQTGARLSKVNKFVEFPLVLNLAPFTSSMSVVLENVNWSQSKILYALFGVVEHSGRLNSGHYVAYIRSRPGNAVINENFLNRKHPSHYKINNLVSDLSEKMNAKIHPNISMEIDPQVVEEDVRTGQWYHLSDSYVSQASISRVLRAQAYLLFYERVS